MSPRVALALLAATTLLPAADARPEQVHVAQTPEGLVVGWALPGDRRSDPPGRVEWGVGGAFDRVAEGALVAYVDGAPYAWSDAKSVERDLAEAPATLYRATIAALPSATQLRYRVVDGQGNAGDSFVARTLPGPDAPVRAVVYADQGTTEDGSLAAPGYRPTEVVALAVARDPDVAIVAGDLAYQKEATARWWNDWFRLVEPLAATTPLYAAPGNHDRDHAAGYGQWHARFNFPGDELNYAFDAGPVHVLVVNSQEACREGQLTQRVQRVHPTCMAATATGLPLENTAITDMMRADLADARLRGMPWTVVVFHHPPYANGGYNETNSGGHYMWWMREHWLPILEEYGVDLVLTGHDHNYQRTWPILADVPRPGGASYQEGDGIVYVVTGGGGRSTYSFPAPDPAWLAAKARAHHVTILDATATSLTVTVESVDGQILDSFTITKTASPAPAVALAGAAAVGLLARAAARRAAQR